MLATATVVVLTLLAMATLGDATQVFVNIYEMI